MVVSVFGMYLKVYEEEEELGGAEERKDKGKVGVNSGDGEKVGLNSIDNPVHDDDDDDGASPSTSNPKSPFMTAITTYRRETMACSLVPCIWSGGFYVSFVWMAIYMSDETILAHPVPNSFLVNSISLFIGVCLFFPYAGVISDIYGRRPTMFTG